LIAAVELVLGGEPVGPGPGDRIEATAGGVVRVHEVLAPGMALRRRWSDPYWTTLRIHTKQVGTE